jgi:signal transduction histidine kinase
VPLLARLRVTASRYGSIAVALGLPLFMLVEAQEARGAPGPVWADAGLAVLAGIALLARLRRPLAALATLLAGAASYAAVWGLPQSAGALLALLLTIYSVPRWGDRRTQAMGAPLLVPALVFLEWRDPTTGTLVEALPTFLLAGAAWAAGEGVRRSAERSRQLAETAEQLRLERAETARLAVAAERLHMARELHDILAHSVSVMVLQVGAARLALGDVPPGAVAALNAAEQVGRQSLDELRRLLTALRDGPEQPRLPQPGLASVPDLFRLVGDRAVEVSVEPDLPQLPPVFDLTAFRITQEAVTNLLKHAPGAPAHVDIRCEADDLVIHVENGPPEGPRPGALRAPGAGHGLQGMAERAAMFGGTVTAGGQPDGSFTVHARLPLPAAATSTCDL